MSLRRWFRLVQIFEVGAVLKGLGWCRILGVKSYFNDPCDYCEVVPKPHLPPTDVIQRLGNHI